MGFHSPLTLTQLLTCSLCSFSLIDSQFLICSSKRFHLHPKSNIDSFQDGHFLDALTISSPPPSSKAPRGLNQFTLKPIKHIWCIEANTCLMCSLWWQRFDALRENSWHPGKTDQFLPPYLHQQTNWRGFAVRNLGGGGKCEASEGNGGKYQALSLFGQTCL